MTAQNMRLCVSCIDILAVSVLMHMIVTVRSVCLHDALSFYANKKSCGFYKRDFTEVFIGSTKKCHMDCFVDSKPSYQNMSWLGNRITEMKIHFVSTTHPRVIVFKKSCFGVFLKTKIYINVTCEQQEMQKDKRCDDDMQCVDLAHSTCNKTIRLCQCMTGYYYLWETKTCVTALSLGESCIHSRQCMMKMPYSTCGTDRKCRCQLAFLELNNSCSPVRRLKESCNAPIQCSEATANSTCNNKTGVCECREGHIEISNTCIGVQILIDGICKNYKSCSNSSCGCEQSEFERVCTSITNTPLRHQEKDKLYETEKNDNSSLVIGVGMACFILGAALGGIVHLIITRNRRKTKLRSKTPSDDATEQLSVQVSQQMNSRLVYNNDIRDNEEGNDVYIHLHQDPFEVDVQSDYDHAPQQMTAEDVYSHMNTCNKTPGLESDCYGEAS